MTFAPNDKYDSVKQQIGTPVSVKNHLPYPAQSSIDDTLTIINTVLEESTNAMAILSPEGVFEWVNATLLELYGLRQDDVIGKTWDYLYAANSGWQVRHAEVRHAVIDRKETWHGVIRDQFSSGAEGWRRIKVFPILDDTGCVIRIGTISDDITASTEAQAAVEETEQNFRALAEKAGDGITIASHTEVYFVNQRLSDISGYTKEELHSPAVAIALLLPEEYGKVREYMQQRLSGQSAPPQYRTLLVRKDGTRIPIELSVSLTTWRGKPASLALTRDISSRVEMERRMRHAEKMQAIGQLAGGVAHDFNNQLGGIIGFADLLHGKVTHDPTLTRYVDGIMTGAKRAADLTGQLLAFARKGQYYAKTVNLHLLINEVSALLHHSIDKRIQIRQVLDAQHPFTTGDSTLLQNALLNLALNARDAMPLDGELVLATRNVIIDEGNEVGALNRDNRINGGNVVIEGDTGEPPEPVRYVCVSVSDTGCGMDEATQERMFEPFFTTKPSGTGTGMGLAAVFGTVEAHHGKINVQSQKGIGTTVTLWLPESRDGVSESDGAERDAAVLTGSGLILLVDDEEMIRDVVADMLSCFGYDVLMAAGGPEAIKLYDARWREIDLVILDMVMPQMSGTDVYNAMRQTNPDAAILISSGYSQGETASELLRNGAAGFIQKPFTQAALSKAVHAAMGQRTQR